MMQQNFKKDSRVWLHKNSRRKVGNEIPKFGIDHLNRQKMKTTQEEEGMEFTPYVNGADGKIYKKDSRTWLHKSSGRSPAAKTTGDNKGLRTATQPKNPRRMWDVLHKVKELVNKDKLNVDSVLPRENSELIRGVASAGKRKKNTPRGRKGLASISHRDIHIFEEWDENAFGTYNHCCDKRPRVRYIKGSYSDHDNTNEESSRSDSDGSNSDDLADIAQHDKKHQRLFRRLCECPLAHEHSRHAILNCNGCDTLPLCRSNASIELSQDGISALREIAREMQLPPTRSCSYLVETPENSMEINANQPLNPVELSSSALCSSKSSLNMVGVNLSDECVTALEEVPGAESDYQLSQATKGLNVQSPTNQCRYTSEQDEKMKVII